MPERRRHPRYRTKPAQVRLLWSSRGVSNTVRGCLRDLSRSGTLAMTNSAPSVSTPVTLSLEGGGGRVSVEAIVVGVTEVVGVSLERWVSYLVRLAFERGLPGGDAGGGGRRPRPAPAG